MMVVWRVTERISWTSRQRARVTLRRALPRGLRYGKNRTRRHETSQRIKVVSGRRSRESCDCRDVEAIGILSRGHSRNGAGICHMGLIVSRQLTLAGRSCSWKRAELNYTNGTMHAQLLHAPPRIGARGRMSRGDTVDHTGHGCTVFAATRRQCFRTGH